MQVAMLYSLIQTVRILTREIVTASALVLRWGLEDDVACEDMLVIARKFLYCIVLYCIVLYCIVLYCIVLYYLVLYFIPCLEK